MQKPTISAKDALKDIRSGMDDDALKKKYGLNAMGLESLFTKLMKAGLITLVELDERRQQTQRGPEVPETPAPVPLIREAETAPAESAAPPEQGSAPREQGAVTPEQGASPPGQSASLPEQGAVPPEQTSSPSEKIERDAWKCPACGAAQPEEQHVCPRCGVIVAKYLKKQAELGRAPQPAGETPSPGSRGPAPFAQPAAGGPQSDTKRCPFCSEEIRSDAAKCKHCGEWLEIPAQDMGRGGREEYCPWEDAASLGWFKAFWDTATSCLFSPKEFFSRIPLSSGYGPPLIYGLIAGTIGTGFGQLWNVLFGLGSKEFRAVAIVMIFLSPVIALVGIGISSVVNHLCLMILGGAHEDFEASFRVVCYSSSAALWQAVPVLGSLIHAVWAVVSIVIGLREAHGTSTGKALGAVLLPLLLCCGLIGILVFVVAGAILGAGHKIL